MRAIKYSFEDHYSILERWWKEHDFSTVHPAALPPGFLIKGDNNDFVCAGFIYTTDSAVRAIEWVVSNPSVEKKEKDKGLDVLFESLLSLTGPGNVIMAWASHPGLIKRYVKHGFIKADEGMTGVIKVQPFE